MNKSTPICYSCSTIWGSNLNCGSCSKRHKVNQCKMCSYKWGSNPQCQTCLRRPNTIIQNPLINNSDTHTCGNRWGSPECTACSNYYKSDSKIIQIPLILYWKSVNTGTNHSIINIQREIIRSDSDSDKISELIADSNRADIVDLYLRLMHPCENEISCEGFGNLSNGVRFLECGRCRKIYCNWCRPVNSDKYCNNCYLNI